MQQKNNETKSIIAIFKELTDKILSKLLELFEKISPHSEKSDSVQMDNKESETLTHSDQHEKTRHRF